MEDINKKDLLPSAAESVEKTKKNKRRKIIAQLKKARKVGEYSVDNYLSTELLEELVNAGYNVSAHYNVINKSAPDYFTISW